MKKLKKIYDIVERMRGADTTGWIIKAAIQNPRCIIICRNHCSAKLLEKVYHRHLSKTLKRFRKSHPTFISIDSKYYGPTLPVIFDNDVFREYND